MQKSGDWFGRKRRISRSAILRNCDRRGNKKDLIRIKPSKSIDLVHEPIHFPNKGVTFRARRNSPGLFLVFACFLCSFRYFDPGLRIVCGINQLFLNGYMFLTKEFFLLTYLERLRPKYTLSIL